MGKKSVQFLFYFITSVILFSCGPKDYHDNLEFTKSDNGAPVNEAQITNPFLATPASTISRVTVGIVANYNEKKSSYFGLCSGVKLNSTTILTAAHCVSTMDTIRIVYGKSVSSAIKNKDIYEVQNILIHTSYLNPNLRAEKRFFDIALIRLKNPLPNYENDLDIMAQFNLLTTTQYTHLRSGSGDDASSEALRLGPMIAGYGFAFQRTTSLSQDNKTVGVLNEAPVQLNLSDYTDRIIKVGADEISQACVGDSGGPLYIWRDDKYYVQGIAISVKDTDKSDPFASSICDKQSYYLNLDFFADWIKTSSESL